MQHFVDEVNITVRSGKGGHGCISFRREKYVPYGGPDGGDGGDGGSVIFHVKSNVRTLYNFKHKKHFFARDGSPGMGKQKTGKKGEDILLDVPPGTLLYNANNNELIKDLIKENSQYIFLNGGKGGKGNMHFATSTNQAPRISQPGIDGKEMVIKLELKLIADVGLVGFPNAGKSTLLSVISKARPKIANYPFTTLVPNLGVFTVESDSFVMADIPGIIEGASNGYGLGFEFLKHIERTKLLLFLINVEDDNYIDQYEKLKYELNNYSKVLKNKPFSISVSKTDIENSKEKIDNLEKVIDDDIIPFSSITRSGIKELLYVVKNKIIEIENE